MKLKTRLLWPIVLVILQLILTGCATKKTKGFEPDGEVDDIPKWIYSPQESCAKSKFCSSGEGDSFTVSDSRAKKNLAGIFETKVSSNFSINTESIQSTKEIDALEERITSEVNETVDQAIKAVEITERFQKDGVFFSQVSLDKRKFSKELRAGIKKHDDELEFIYESRKKSAYKKLIYLSESRYLLNEKYILLTGKSISPKISQKKVLTFKYQDQNNQNVKIFWDRKTGKRKLRAMLAELLTESGYKIVDTDSYSFGVYLTINTNKAYSNIRGFVKYDYKVQVHAKNSSQKEVGSFVVNELVTGRTQQDTWIKVRPIFVKKIKENLHKLNI